MASTLPFVFVIAMGVTTGANAQVPCCVPPCDSAETIRLAEPTQIKSATDRTKVRTVQRHKVQRPYGVAREPESIIFRIAPYTLFLA